MPLIRLTITDDIRCIDVRTDAAYSPDILDDLSKRAVVLAIAHAEATGTAS